MSANRKAFANNNYYPSIESLTGFITLAARNHQDTRCAYIGPISLSRRRGSGKERRRRTRTRYSDKTEEQSWIQMTIDDKLLRGGVPGGRRFSGNIVFDGRTRPHPLCSRHNFLTRTLRMPDCFPLLSRKNRVSRIFHGPFAWDG